MIYLDLWLFGNGRGLAAPYSSQKFLWLVDENSGNRSGQFYTLSRGFGAQLTSFEWITPKLSERRMFNGLEFKPYLATFWWLRVYVSWACIHSPNSTEDLDAIIQQISCPRYCYGP